MTTTRSALPLGRRIVPLTHQIIVPLQSGYLADRPDAVATLARLRRGAGKPPEDVPDLWGLVDTGALYEDLPPGTRPATQGAETALERAENALHVALTLWALHQQSRREGMHRRDEPARPAGLGAAVRRLMPGQDIDEPLRRRLVRAGNAPDLTTLAQRLRDIVPLLRPADIALDYALLAHQLYRWQQTGGREEVRRAWGRSFHTHRTREGDGDPPTDSAGSPGTPDLTGNTDKDVP
ncbi:type I-E CRISPR-associated protein Cse2/CasB [Streptomyces xiamenensis]|uniref:type I-E CRISPR-associated protein Cse2/CasB n=1 Tax=Streptomyces xiamenensis TaxID=408015 RepID=UPI0037CFF67B